MDRHTDFPTSLSDWGLKVHCARLRLLQRLAVNFYGVGPSLNRRRDLNVLLKLE